LKEQWSSIQSGFGESRHQIHKRGQEDEKNNVLHSAVPIHHFFLAIFFPTLIGIGQNQIYRSIPPHLHLPSIMWQ
jgi:hypothetical protein